MTPNTTQNIEHLLRETEAAAVLNVTVAALRKWRTTGRHNLRFIRLGGGRAIRYSPADLRVFIESQRRTWTRGPAGDGGAR